MKNLSLIIITAALLISGCYTQSKAKKQFLKVHANHPIVSAKYCSEFYPTRDSTIIKSEYIAGDTIITTEWKAIDCDSLIKIKNTLQNAENKGSNGKRDETIYNRKGTNTFYIPTHSSSKTDTLREYKEVIRENTAKISFLTLDNEQLSKSNAVLTSKLDDETKRKNRWRTIAFIAIGVIVAYGIARLYKLFGILH